MAKQKGLKTLGDYRKATKEPFFNNNTFPESTNPAYDAIRESLVYCRRMY